MTDKLVKTVTLSTPKRGHSDGQLHFTIKFFDNGDANNNLYSNIEVSAGTYVTTTLTAYGGISSSELRELANEIDRATVQYQRVT